MHQNWDNLLFMHWPVSSDLLRPLVPAPLELDTFEGQTWLGVTPFTLNDIHLTGLPAVPGLSSFEELNVRTYVLYNGTPGIWFLSLDASRLVAALAARLFFMLPYFNASIDYTTEGGLYQFKLQRAAPPAEFEATWQVGIRLREPHLESLAFFLVERYCYFVVHQGLVYQTRVYHAPWILEEAILKSHRSTLIHSLGIPDPVSEPIVHFSRHQSVDIWAPSAA